MAVGDRPVRSARLTILLIMFLVLLVLGMFMDAVSIRIFRYEVTGNFKPRSYPTPAAVDGRRVGLHSRGRNDFSTLALSQRRSDEAMQTKPVSEHWIRDI